MLYLCIFWFILQLLRTRLERLSTSSTQISISRSSFHLSTSLLNELPLVILDWIPHRHTQISHTKRRRLGVYWDVGVIFIILSFIISQFTLVYALVKALVALYHLVLSPSSIPTVALSKRAPVPLPLPDSPQSDLLFKPLIPGLTTSLNGLPTLIIALISSQLYHEFAHSLSAASEGSTIDSVGFYLFFLLPTFYVKLSPTPLSQRNHWMDLRVASAGVWHNVQLVLIGWIGMEKEVGGLGGTETVFRSAFERIEEGVRVQQVEKDSPLFELISPTTLITHLNDLELDSSTSSLQLYNSYLGQPTSAGYDDMGWCLSKSLFTPLSSENSTSPCSNSTSSHTLRFTSSTANEEACLDPLPLLPPSKEIPTRCIDQSSCQVETVCARIDSREEVLRIGVRDGNKQEGRRVVIWKGPRREFQKTARCTVQVTDLTPLYSWIPLWFPLIISRFFSALFTLSLTLGFLNLLPLPMLDGEHILTSFLSCVASGYNHHRNFSSLPLDREGFREPDQGLLAWVMGGFVRNRVGGWVYRNRERVERGFKAWTIVIGVGLVGVTVMVYIGSALVGRQ